MQGMYSQLTSVSVADRLTVPYIPNVHVQKNASKIDCHVRKSVQTPFIQLMDPPMDPD